MAEPAKQELPTIVSFVREAWEHNEGNMSGATESLFTTISRDQAMLGHILPGVLKTWCREQVGDYVGRLRVMALAPVENPSQGGRLRAVIGATLFDFPLPGGKRLGDANAAEIRKGAESYSDAASDAAHKARWLAMVADRVGRKNRAETALTAQQLEELFEEARDGQ